MWLDNKMDVRRENIFFSTKKTFNTFLMFSRVEILSISTQCWTTLPITERERERGSKRNFHQVSLITTHFCTHSLSFNVFSLAHSFSLFHILFTPFHRSTSRSALLCTMHCVFWSLFSPPPYFCAGKVAQNFTDLKLKRLFHRKNGPEFIQQWHLRWHFIWAMAFAALVQLILY